MTIKNKIIAGFGVITAIILVVGLIGFSGIRQLSSDLNFIVGPAWDTADGAMEGTIGLQAEMLAVEKILQGAPLEREMTKLKEGEKTAGEAIARLLEAGLMNDEEVQAVLQSKQEYENLLWQLLDDYKRFATLKREFDEHVEAFVALGEEMEEIGDAAMEEFEQSPDQAFTWNGAIRERWLAADGGMESNIGLLWGLYHIDRLIDRSETPEAAKAEINAALAFQREASEEMLGTGRFDLPAGQQWNNRRYASVYSDLLQTHESLIAALVDATIAYHQTHDRYITQAEQLLTLLGGFEAAGDQAVEGEIEHIRLIQSNTETLTFAALIAGLVIAITLAVLILRAILIPLGSILSRLRDIARGEGDLTQRIHLSSNDELGRLAREFNYFIDHIHQLIKDVKTKRESMGHTVVEMKSLMSETQHTVLRQQNETDQIATAITEMAATAREITNNTHSAADTAEQASGVSTQARETVESAIENISSLSDELKDAAQVVSGLEEDVGQIVGVLDVIVGIAEQTNLLALNAAIEAARAGEQGRGFAVVADEVRGLAGRTQQSTEEIQQMIERLKTSSRKAVDVMHRSNQKSDATVKQSTEVSQALQHILNSVKDINDATQMIAAASEQQAATSDEMNNNVLRIVDSAQRVTDSMHKTGEHCEQTLRNSEELGELVRRFKV